MVINMGGRNKNSPTIGDNGYMIKPGDNSKALNTILGITQMPKIDLNSDEEVQNRIREYFEYCAANDLKPGVESMALALGVDRRTLWDWEKGVSRNSTPTRSEIIKQAKRTLAAYLEFLAQNGKINPVTAIFLFKTQFGYIETTHIEVASKQPIDELPLEEIEKRIPKYIPVDADYTEE